MKSYKHRLQSILLGAACTVGVVGAGELEVANHSFEKGMGGFWTNRPAVVRVDSTDSTDGKQCLAVEPTEGKRVDLVQGITLVPGELYTLTFDARTSTLENGPGLAIETMLQGAKPIQFFYANAEQKKAMTTPAKLTEEWQTLTYVLGPFPESFRNQDVKKVMFFWRVQPGENEGKIFLDNIKISTAPASEEAGQKKNNAISSDPIRFGLPSAIRIFESAPVFTVEGDVADGHLRVAATDAFGRAVFSQEGKMGEGTLAVRLPGPDYYDVTAEIIRDGKVWKSAGTSLLVTTPLPSDYYDTPHPAFGVWGGLNPEMRRLGGAKWDRQLFFSFFQKADAKAEPPSAEVINAREPIKIIRCMNIMHPFKKMVPYTPEELAEQKEKLTKEVISRRGLVDVWETQNEPMVGENFHGTMKDVMDIIKMESDVVRTHDPGRPLAGICINPMNANQYNQYVGYYRNYGIDQYIDALMLHPYIPGAQSPDASGYVDVLNNLDREIGAIAGRRIPMYISEIGYSTKPGGEVTELQQAAYLARVVLLNRQIPGLQACVWHIGLWNAATSRRELDFGLLRGHANDSPVREPKPGFAAWATVSRMTYNANYLRELEISRQVRVLLFEKEGKPMIVAYALNLEGATLQLPFNTDSVMVTEVCGKQYPLPPNDGILTLELTEAPVYLVGGELADFNTDRFAATFEPENFSVFPGGTLKVKLTLPEELVKGKKVNVTVPGGKLGVATVSGEGRDWNLALPVNEKTVPGFYDLFFRLSVDGRSRFIWQKPLEVKPLLRLEDVVAGARGIRFRVSSAYPGAEAKLDILEDGEKQLASADITGGAEFDLLLSGAGYGRKVSYQARFTLSDGRSWMQSIPAEAVPVTIPRFDNALDRAETDWPATGVYRIADGAASRHAVRGEFDVPQGTIRLAYDDKFLYFSIDEKDAVFKTFDAPSLWNGDSLQIGVSVAQTFMIRLNNDGIQETAYAEFGVKADSVQPDSWVWASMNLNEMGLNAPIPGLVSRSGYQDGVIRYRFAVPWKTLNIKPSTAMPLGISILFNDRDEAKDRHWVEWYSGIADGKDPGRYGSAVLVPEK